MLMVWEISKPNNVIIWNSALDFFPDCTPTLDLLISNTYSENKYDEGFEAGHWGEAGRKNKKSTVNKVHLFQKCNSGFKMVITNFIISSYVLDL